MADTAWRRIVRAGLALSLAWPLWARAAGLSLDFGQALDLALRQNPDLLAAQAQVDAAQAGLEQADAAPAPRVTLSAGAVRTDDALNAFGLKLEQRRITAQDFAVGTLNQPAPVNDFSSTLAAQLPIYTGGRLRAYLQQARAMLRAAQAGDLAARQQLTAQVLQAYDGVHAAQAFEGVAAQAAQAAQTQLDAAQHLYDQGVVTQSDLLSAQVGLEQAKLQQQQAQDLEAHARDALHVVLGLPLQQELQLGGEASVDLPAGGVDAWIGEAIERNPQIQALRAQLDAAQAGVAAARAELYPQLGATASVGTHDANPQFGASHGYAIGAQLSWTLFDGGVARDGIDKAAAERMRLQQQLAAAQNQLGLQVQDAWRQLRDAQRQVQTDTLAVQQTAEAARIVGRRYADGVGTLLEMQGAQAQLDKARADLVLARERSNEQRGALRLALGELDAAAVHSPGVAVSP
jgi:outer membrane protein TolC